MMPDGGTIMSRGGCSAPSDALLTWLDEEGASLTVRPPTACPPSSSSARTLGVAT